MNTMKTLKDSLSKVLRDIESTIDSGNDECVEFQGKMHCNLFGLFSKPRDSLELSKLLIGVSIKQEGDRPDLGSLIKVITKEKEIHWKSMYEAHRRWYEMELRGLGKSDEECLSETAAVLRFISKTYSEYAKELEEYTVPLKAEDFERLYRRRLRNVNPEDDEFGDFELGPDREVEWTPEKRTLRGDEDDPLDGKYEIQSDGVKARLFSLIHEAYFGAIAPCLFQAISDEASSTSLNTHRRFVCSLSDVVSDAFSEDRNKPFACVLFFLVRTAVLLTVSLLGLDHDREMVRYVNERLEWVTDKDAAQSVVYTIKSLFYSPECAGFQGLRDELCLALAGYFNGDPAVCPLDKLFTATVGFLVTGYPTCARLTGEQVSEYWRCVVEAETRAQTLNSALKGFRRISSVFPQETFPFSAAALLLRSCERTPESVHNVLSLLKYSCSQSGEGKLSSVVNEIVSTAAEGRECSEWVWVLGVAASASQNTELCAVWHRFVLESVVRNRIVDVVFGLWAIEDKYILRGDTDLPEACLGHAVLCFMRESFTDCVFDSFEFCAQELDLLKVKLFVESVAGVRNLGGLCASRFGESFSRGFSVWSASSVGHLIPEMRREVLHVIDVASGVVASRASCLTFENAIGPAVTWLRRTSEGASSRELVGNALSLLRCKAYRGGMRREWRRLAYHELLSVYRNAETTGRFSLSEELEEEDTFQHAIDSSECTLVLLSLDAIAAVAVEKVVNNSLGGVRELAETLKRVASTGGVVQRFVIGYAFVHGVGAVLKLIQRGAITCATLPGIEGLFALEGEHNGVVPKKWMAVVYKEYELGLSKVRALFRQQAEDASSVAFHQHIKPCCAKRTIQSLWNGQDKTSANFKLKKHMKLVEVATEGTCTPNRGSGVTLHVVRDPDNGTYSMYKLLMNKVYKGPVRPEHVFWCTEHSTVADLETFLSPSSSHAQFPLSVVEANKLPRRAFLFLCGWVGKVQHKAKQCSCNLHVVFSSPELLDQFPLATSREDDGSYDENTEPSLPRKQVAVSKIVFVTGEPRSGKSEYIRRTIGTKKGTLVRVDGCFTEGRCIQSLLSRKGQRSVLSALIFDVSDDDSSPALERFQHFLYNLVTWGIISDRDTGEVLELRSFGCVEVYIEASTRHSEELQRFLSLLPCEVEKRVADGRMRDYGNNSDLTLVASVWEARNARDAEGFLLACRSGVALRRRASDGFLAHLARACGSLASQRRYVKAAARQCRLLLEQLEHTDDPRIGESLRAIDTRARQFACVDVHGRPFQLARPEEVLSDASLPKELVAEYFLRQEHLSIVRFIQSVIKTSSGRWCVLTRTSRELVYAHSNLGILGSVQEGVVAISLDVMETFLEGVRCSEEGKSSIVCVADLELCTAEEMHRATDVLSSCGGRAVILVLHFPERLANSAFRLAASFADGWETVYVDSLGLSVDAEGVVTEGDPGCTARYWIASALSENHNSTLEQGLGHGIYAAASDMWRRIRWGRRSIRLPKDLCGVIEEDGAAFRGFAQRATEVWRDSLVRGVVCGREAGSPQSLLCRVNCALERFQVLSAKVLLSALCDNSTLETVTSAAEEEEEKRLITLALSAVELPDVESVFGNEQIPMRFTPKKCHPKPPYVPLFDAISACVERGVETLEKLSSCTEGLLKHISSSERLLTWYKRDLVVRSMGLGEFYVPKGDIAAGSSKGVLLDVCVSILESFAGDRNSIEHLHVALKEHYGDIMSAVVFLRPLLSCINTNPFPNNAFLPIDLPARFTLQQHVFVSAVRFLWSYCKTLPLSPASHRESEYIAVCSALSTLRNMIPHFSSLSPYSAEDAGKYVLMHTAALFSLFEGSSGALSAFGTLSAFEPHTFPSLEQCLAFCEAIFRSHASSGHTVKYPREFLVSVALFFCGGGTDSQSSLDDISFLLRQHTSEDAHNIAKRYLSPETVLRLVWVWMSAGAPKEWRDRAICVISPEILTKGEQPVDLLDASRERMGSSRYMYYHLCIQSLRIGVSDAGSAPEEKLLFLDGALKSTPPGTLADAAHTCVLLETLAHICRDSPDSALGVLSGFPDLCSAHAPNALNTVPFFLSCLGDDAAVGRVCTNRPLHERVGMAELYTRTDVSVMCCYPPYAVDPSGPLRRLYDEVRACVAAEDPRGFVEGIRRTLSVPEADRGLPRQVVVGAVRMMVVTALYYEHFLEGRKRPGVREGLAELREELDVASALEMKALAFFTRGPFVTKNEDNFDPTVTMYSSRRLGRAAQAGRGERSVVPHMMANLLAYTLGCPRDATVMYERVFHLEGIGAGFCPGSAYLRKNADCGFKMDEALQRAVPPIMGENVHRRLLLNTMVWGAFTWSQLLDDAGAEKAERVPNFVNKLVPNYVVNGQRRTKRANYRAYMHDRAQSFFMAASADRRWNSLQFLNEALHLHFLRAHGALGQVRGRGLRARYATEEQAIEYEAEVEAIFAAVERDYTALTEKCADGLDNKILRDALRLRQRERGAARLFPLDAGAKALADYAALRAHKEASYMFVDEFMRHLPKFRLLRHLPAVVCLCRELYKAFHGKIEEYDMKSYEFTVGEAISKYGGGRTELLGAWEAVKDVWEEIREGIHPEECHAAQEFERDLVKLDDGTPLRVLVGTEEDGNRGGELFRVIKDGLAPIQDNFLVKCETKYADLFSASARAPPLSLESLVDSNAAAAAVQLVAYDSERLMSELCALVLNENGAFDGESVARYIMWTQVQGKPRIDTGKTSFRWKSIV